HLATQGKYAEAEPLFRRSLAIKTKAYGLEHPQVVIALSYLASVLESMVR
ncbi:unnamed protein product, partial [Scytosiphon promiscuus]